MRFTVATNTARDVGARLMAITIWGLEAGGGAYAAITALTNIAATLLAAVFYELVFADYHRGECQPPFGLVSKHGATGCPCPCACACGCVGAGRGWGKGGWIDWTGLD